jgi:hypothetical protein
MGFFMLALRRRAGVPTLRFGPPPHPQQHPPFQVVDHIDRGAQPSLTRYFQRLFPLITLLGQKPFCLCIDFPTLQPYSASPENRSILGTFLTGIGQSTNKAQSSWN